MGSWNNKKARLEMGKSMGAIALWIWVIHISASQKVEALHFIPSLHSFFANKSCEKDVSIEPSNMVKQTNKMMVLVSLIKIFSKSFVGRKTSLQMRHGYISYWRHLYDDFLVTHATFSKSIYIHRKPMKIWRHF